MSTEFQVIHIHPEAPVKPALGQSCNGCGVCCLSQPCPVGMVLSLRRTGACLALAWDAELQMYRCGALIQPQQVLSRRLPVLARWAARPLAPLLRLWAGRWIAAGVGCDSTLEAGPSSTMAAQPNTSRKP